MRILVTRPRDDAEGFAEKLRARGHAVLIEPLLDIRHLPGVTVDLDGVQALLFTSANGVRAFAAASPRRDLGVLAVGDATAAAARAVGFNAVQSAGGNVEDLARLAIAVLRPANGALFHAAGSAIAGDLSGRLEAAGFSVRRAVLYRAETATALTAETRAALASGAVDVVALFSPRTAKTFASLAIAAGLRDSCAKAAMLALSPAVIDAAASLPWRARATAAEPNEAALLVALDRVAAPPSPPPPKPAAAPTAKPTNIVAIGGATLVGLVALIALATWIGSRGQPSATDKLAAQLAATERQVASLGAALAAQAELARAVGGLDQRLAALQGRIGELDSRLAAPPTPSTDIVDLRRRVDGLAAPREDPQVAALLAETRRLAGELSRVQDGVAGLSTQLAERAPLARPEAAPALAALRQAIAAGGPFAAELLTLQAAAGDDTAARATLAELVPFAERGVPSFERLRQRFARVAVDIVRARPRDPDAAWWQPAATWAESLVTVRPVGEVPGDTPPAVVARAERRLADGNLAAAEAQLSALGGPAADAAATWRRDAQARLAADRLVEALEPLVRSGSAAR